MNHIFTPFATLIFVIGSSAFFAGCANSPIGSSTGNSDFGDNRASSKESMLWSEDFEWAQSEAQQTGRVIMANFTGSDWCGWCIKLDKEVFSTEEFQQWAEENVVLLKVDFPKRSRQDPEIAKQNEDLRSRYSKHIQGYPTILFLSETGEVMGNLGYVKGGPKAFIAKTNRSLESRVASNKSSTNSY